MATSGRMAATATRRSPLKGQLKQAAQQSAAGGYIREGAFRLDVKADHFLYESTTKRKSENNTQKK